MEKNDIIERIKKMLLETIDIMALTLIVFGAYIILFFISQPVPFFPILFLFWFYYFIGHPLFVKYVLKKKWDECLKNYDTKFKYLIAPYLISELIVMAIYWQETLFVIDTIMESYGWK